MSEFPSWEQLIRRIEEETGVPFSAEDRQEIDKGREQFERALAMAKDTKEMAARVEAYEESPIVAFMRNLMTRQGTITPDFDTLYKKKAEIDRKLLDDEPQ